MAENVCPEALNVGQQTLLEGLWLGVYSEIYINFNLIQSNKADGNVIFFLSLGNTWKKKLYKTWASISYELTCMNPVSL